jgi:hypothetical protein
MQTVIRFTRRIESETLYMPEIGELVGQEVEIVVSLLSAAQPVSVDSLKGSVLRYDEPFEPVAVEDWEALS